MKSVTYIFVNKEKTLFDKWLGWLITAFEHGDDFASHVAIQFDYLNGYGPCIIEAIGRGVVISDYKKYVEVPKQCRIDIDLTDEEYAVLEAKVVEIVEHKYSYSFKSNLIGGIADSVSRRLAKVLAVLFRADKDNEMNCSETGTIILESVYPNIVTNEEASEVTPFHLYIKMAIAGLEGKIHISKITMFEEAKK